VEEACDNASIEELQLINSIAIVPNPFVNEVQIEFEVMEPTILELKIYNHLGVKVYHVKEKQNIGHQEISWKAINLPSGIYYCVIRVGDGVQTRKMVKL